MSKETKKEGEKLSQKDEYNFGSYSKVPLKEKDLEYSIFACADAMPGGDGRDPTRLPPAS